MTTASILFAGEGHRPGGNRCYYCGCGCDDSHEAKKYVKETFTNRDLVKRPASGYVCQGCVMSIGDGWEDMRMLDGSTRPFDPARPRSFAPRLYSWLLSREGRLAFTKAHIGAIRETLSDPSRLPEPPFSVILADSGQKQLIFRAPVAYGKEAFAVMLEDEPIEITPESLRERLALAGRVSSKVGKPVLKEPASMSAFIAAEKAEVAKELSEWEKIRCEPLSRLAAWLAPAKEK